MLVCDRCGGKKDVKGIKFSVMGRKFDLCGRCEKKLRGKIHKVITDFMRKDQKEEED